VPPHIQAELPGSGDVVWHPGHGRHSFVADPGTGAPGQSGSVLHIGPYVLTGGQLLDAGTEQRKDDAM